MGEQVLCNLIINMAGPHPQPPRPTQYSSYLKALKRLRERKRQAPSQKRRPRPRPGAAVGSGAARSRSSRSLLRPLVAFVAPALQDARIPVQSGLLCPLGARVIVHNTDKETEPWEWQGLANISPNWVGG